MTGHPSATNHRLAVGELTVVAVTDEGLGNTSWVAWSVKRPSWSTPSGTRRRTGPSPPRSERRSPSAPTPTSTPTSLTYRDIAQKLFVSTRTVDMHVRNLLTKLGCRTRTEAVRRAADLARSRAATP